MTNWVTWLGLPSKMFSWRYTFSETNITSGLLTNPKETWLVRHQTSFLYCPRAVSSDEKHCRCWLSFYPFLSAIFLASDRGFFPAAGGCGGGKGLLPRASAILAVLLSKTSNVRAGRARQLCVGGGTFHRQVQVRGSSTPTRRATSSCHNVALRFGWPRRISLPPPMAQTGIMRLDGPTLVI